VRRPVQVRVVNAVKTWVDRYKQDFAESPELCAKTLAFLRSPPIAEGVFRKSVEHVAQELERLVRFVPWHADDWCSAV